jgi:hypothetical protein
MSEDRKPELPQSHEPPHPHEQPPPDPIEDVRKGLGLLFRAAKRAFESLPTGKVEDVVISGAREVGRAIENVTQTLDKQFFNRDRPESASKEAGAASDAGPGETKPDDAPAPPPDKKSEPPPGQEPRGPRVE